MKSPKKSIKNHVPTAIIGMGCFFPRSSGLKEYWRLIAQGQDGITEVPASHWSTKDYYHPDPKTPDHVYCNKGGFLSPVMFDPVEFGLPPHTLEATDTSQILGLVAAKMALADAGYGDDNNRNFNRDRTSVILGVTGTQELVIPLSSRLGFPKWRRALEAAGLPADTTQKVIEDISGSYVGWQENSFPGLLGNVVAGKICNRLNLGGTNCVVDAACASSMSAIHLAVLELACDRSDMVITGGVDTLNDIFMHMCFAKTQTLSPTGDARPFAENADGTVLGEGIGMLVLKRLPDAQKDGDRIYAVIRALGSASDGKSQSIYAPRVEGQVKALQEAYRNSGVKPSTVELVEAHGTGTRVGDKVEFNALCQVFDKPSRNGNKCALGSVKSMIGHTKAAAGAAGLIKTALSLYHKILPPTLKVDRPDPALDMDHSAFYLNTETRPWIKRTRHPRRASVSAFGFGGSNFHIVVEEYRPDKDEISWDGSVEIVAFSGSDPKQLARDLSGLITAIEKDGSKRRLSSQAAESRCRFSPREPYRLLFTLDQPLIESGDYLDLFKDALTGLESGAQKFTGNSHNCFYGGPESRGKLAMIFPGQGSQYIRMARDLICYFPEALDVMGKANKTFHKEQLLSDYIYPHTPQTGEEEKGQIETLIKTDIAQPAIGAISIAMLQILQRFGIRPDAVCGHSFGELTALHAAGCIDQPSFLKLATKRGKIMAAVAATGSHPAKGSMLAVSAPLDKIKNIIQKHDLDITLANLNSPSQGVVSGQEAAVTAVEKIFNQNGFKTVRLPVSAAFHSPLVGEARKPFMTILKRVRFNPPDMPVYSNSTAKPYPMDPADMIELLGNHLLKPVDFVSVIENLYQSGIRTFVEVGPKSILTGLVRSILQGRPFRAIAMDRSSGARFGLTDLALTLCQLAVEGYDVELDKWESPVADIREPKMRIPILGTNYRNLASVTKPETSTTPEPHRETGHDRLNTISPRPMDYPEKNMPQPSTYSEKKNTMKKEHQPNTISISAALKTIQDGLKSMQMLQIKTAETHQQFLQAQAEASRTLQSMMERTQRLAEASLGISSVPQNLTEIPQTQPAVYPNAGEIRQDPDASLGPKTPSQYEISPNAISPKSDPIADSASGASDDPGLQLNSEPTDGGRLELQDTLLDLVSQLTGYPVEMLGLDMDMESDLGIDSIKRVEIFSTLEEKIPNLPSMSPDILGRLKTLGQIIDYMSDASGTDSPDSAAAASATAPKPAADETIRTIPVDNRRQELLDNLLATVHQLTGYPVEMLGLDMDIEADLGIDSIKRVEILSTLEETIPNLPAVSPDILGSLKTLGQIVDHLDAHDPTNGTLPVTTQMLQSQADASFHPDESTGPKYTEAERISDRVNRYVVTAAPITEPKESGIQIPSGSKVLITDDKKGLSQALVEEFKRRNIESSLIPPDSIPPNQNSHTAGGLVLVPDPDSSFSSEDLKNAFTLAQNIAPQLLQSAENGGAIFASITRLDGAFGFNGARLHNPLQGAFAGLVKTAAIEWQAVSCHAIDIAPDWRPYREIAGEIVNALLRSDGAVEIGMDHDKRMVPELVAAPFAERQNIRIDLNPNDVVVVTGGARGITAVATNSLANITGANFVLLGRTSYPTVEPVWLKGLTHQSDMKKAILENQFKNRKTSPALLEKAYRQHCAQREVSATIDQLRATGATVSYHSVDVRDAKAVKSVLEAVRTEHGPIKAVIHGAGVLEDRLILDKTVQQFEKVFDTKVKGLVSLLEATRPDALKYLVLFSSITARIGNRGQVDYAMANEAINKIAQHESKERPQCKVLSINWGPWTGGMVNSALKKEFERNGIELISLDDGAKCLLYEMSQELNGPVEVVVGSNTMSDQSATSRQYSATDTASVPQKEKEEFLITFKREIDVDSYPILGSHVIGGKPVVPLALMTEWFAHSALHNNPGLFLCGFDDMRVLQGVKIEQDKRTVRLLAGRARKKSSAWEVAVELRDGFKNGIEVIHSRAKAVMSDTLSPAPTYHVPVELEANHYPRSVEEVYAKILFHGTDLRGIKEIISLSQRGMMAIVGSAPLPSAWMKQPLRNHWIGDPLVLDSAFQMATVWCYENLGAVSLPSYIGSYRQYRSKFPAEGVTAVLEIQSSSEHKMTGDITFLDRDNKVVARITGYQAVADQSLFKAFKGQISD